LPNNAVFALYELYIARCIYSLKGNIFNFSVASALKKLILFCMKNLETANNEAIREELGQRLKSERLNRNITQNVLAEKAGISRRTLVGAERGEPFTIDTLISILRELNCLAQISLFLPEPEISPIQLSKLKGKKRQRAGGKFTYPKPRSTPWVWNEE